MRIGALCERFICDVSFWVESRYERQWLDTAVRLLNGNSGVFLTSITDPSNSTFIRWWAAYLAGDIVVLQEQICFLDELSEPLDLERPEEALRPREAMSEDGEPISEWTAPLTSLKDFIHRRGGFTMGTDSR